MGGFRIPRPRETNNYFKLFKAIKNGKVKNEEEASRYLDMPSRSAYLRFRARYIQKLLINLESSNEIKFQGGLLDHDLAEIYTKAKTLRDLGDHKSAIELFKMAHGEAVKVGYLETAISAALELRSIYAYIITDRKKYHHYDTLIANYERQYDDYLMLKRNYDRLSNLHIIERNKEVFDQEAEKILVNLETLDYENSMHWFKVRYLDMLMFLYSHLDNIPKAEAISKEAIEYNQ